MKESKGRRLQEGSSVRYVSSYEPNLGVPRSQTPGYFPAYDYPLVEDLQDLITGMTEAQDPTERDPG